MTLGDVYRDINSMLSSYNIDNERFNHLDTVKAINDACSDIYIEATRNRTASAVAVTQFLSSVSVDVNYPYFLTATLARPILNSADPRLAILNALGYKTASELTNGFTSFAKHQKVYKGTKLFLCLESYTGVNTFNKTFTSEDLRTFSLNNNVVYFPGNVILHENSYWKVLDRFDNNGVEIEEGALFTKVYWLEIGEAYDNCVVYPFDRLSEMKLIGDPHMDTTKVVTVQHDKLFVTPNTSGVVITYIPEWEIINDLDQDLGLPNEWIPRVKTIALTALYRKLGIAPRETDGNS